MVEPSSDLVASVGPLTVHVVQRLGRGELGHLAVVEECEAAGMNHRDCVDRNVADCNDRDVFREHMADDAAPQRLLGGKAGRQVERS